MSAVAKVILATGGTGGHVFPARAVAQQLLSRGIQPVFVTDLRGVDYARLESSVDVHRIDAATPSGKNLFGKLWAIFSILRGAVQAIALLRREQPCAVIGFGGYPALPTMLAATTLGFPSILHEQNSVLGRVNRFLASRVDRVALTFAHTRGLPAAAADKQVVTGNPVRDGIIQRAASPLPEDAAGRLHLLVFGGSQGARILSRVAPQAICALDKELRDRLVVVQQCRPEDEDEVRDIYADAGVSAEVETFFHDMPARLVAAHLVLARAGASSVCEIAVVGRPSLLVPFAGAMDDHQTSNARNLEQVGAAQVITEAEFTAENLGRILSGLLADEEKLKEMAKAAAAAGKPEAAHLLADQVMQFCGGNNNKAGAGS